jgi:hypothetical protein
VLTQPVPLSSILIWKRIIQHSPQSVASWLRFSIRTLTDTEKSATAFWTVRGPLYTFIIELTLGLHRKLDIWHYQLASHQYYLLLTFSSRVFWSSASYCPSVLEFDCWLIPHSNAVVTLNFHWDEVAFRDEVKDHIRKHATKTRETLKAEILAE